jgi:dinuclear metal center YbgI/SA1388 family protein
VKSSELISYLDEYLRVNEIDDTAINGLQVAGPEEIARVAFAVDGCQASFDEAVARGVQLLVVHHGLFWGESLRLVGPHYLRVKTLLDGACGLYAVHLPLDAHPEVGNNTELARLLGLGNIRALGTYRGIDIGRVGDLIPPLDMPALLGRVAQAMAVPPIRVLAHGPETARRVACISGDAASMMDQVERAGVDTFITGETDHARFHEVAERGLNVIFSGHYATETLGVKALARHLEDVLGLTTVFLDFPTGM